MFASFLVNRSLNSSLTSLTRTRSFLSFKPNILIKPQLSRSFNVRIHTPNRPNKFSLIFKSFIFTAGFTGASYSFATVIQYEREIRNRNNYPFERNKSKYFQARNELNEFWNSLSEVKKAVLGIIFVNSIVLLAGFTPKFRNFMFEYFVSSTYSRKSSELLLSALNHNGFLHFGINMFVLYNMASYIQHIIPPAEQFLAFYLSAGVFAGFVSKTVNILANRTVMSVGASGALMSCFALISMVAPHAQFYIIPFPFPIEAHMLLKVVAGVDLVCLLLGFSRIDHACHLGGVLYGLALVEIGQKNMKSFQKKILELWNQIINH